MHGHLVLAVYQSARCVQFILAAYADRDMPCTLTLKDAKIGDRVQQAGLYLLHYKAPFVTPLMSVPIATSATEVVLPMSGKELGDAFLEDFMSDLGLCIRHV